MMAIKSIDFISTGLFSGRPSDIAPFVTLDSANSVEVVEGTERNFNLLFGNLQNAQITYSYGYCLLGIGMSVFGAVPEIDPQAMPELQGVKNEMSEEEARL